MGNDVSKKKKGKGKKTKEERTLEERSREKERKGSVDESPFGLSREQVVAEERPLHNLAQLTELDIATIRELKMMFTEISQSEVDDGVIDLKELTAALGLKPSSVLAKHLFRLFDSTRTQKITFRVWVTTISSLSETASLANKIKFSFSLYDMNNDGKIDKRELKALLVSALSEHSLDLQLTNEQVEEIVDNTLKHVDKDGNGTVEYEEYEAMVMNNPEKLKESFTLNINELCEQYKRLRRKNESFVSASEVRKRTEHLQEKVRLQEEALEAHRRKSLGGGGDEDKMLLRIDKPQDKRVPSPTGPTTPGTPGTPSGEGKQKKRRSSLFSLAAPAADPSPAPSSVPKPRKLTNAPSDDNIDTEARPVNLRNLSGLFGSQDALSPTTTDGDGIRQLSLEEIPAEKTRVPVSGETGAKTVVAPTEKAAT